NYVIQFIISFKGDFNGNYNYTGCFKYVPILFRSNALFHYFCLVLMVYVNTHKKENKIRSKKLE
ncbi:hypothetical protein L9F63_028347, partial [Diploptera punctata]